MSARLRWAVGAARFTMREPLDGLDRVRERVRGALGMPDEAPSYQVDRDWERRLHETLGVPWPCPAADDFESVWSAAEEAVRRRGLAIGRGTYGGWDDGDPALARAIWCLIHHRRLRTVVETGVARGITSRVILEALERAGEGHLWSIDLPAMDPELRGQIGAAVPPELRERWTYIEGTSRRRLPGLLAEVGPIDLFVHDSSHTGRNVSFELAQAWPALGSGAVVADDIHQSGAFEQFVTDLPAGTSYFCEADDGRALFGVALKN